MGHELLPLRHDSLECRPSGDTCILGRDDSEAGRAAHTNPPRSNISWESGSRGAQSPSGSAICYRVTELTKAVTLRFTVSCGARHRLKSAKRRSPPSRVQEDPELLTASQGESGTHCFPGVGVAVCEVLPANRACPALCPEPQHSLITCRAISLQPSEGRASCMSSGPQGTESPQEPGWSKRGPRQPLQEWGKASPPLEQC